jgi:hypothetical protein
MAPSIDQLVEQAYKSIDAQSDYTLPRLEHWKKNNKHGIKKVSACHSCGKPILHATDKYPTRCEPCRKKVKELLKIRRSKSFCKNSVIPLEENKHL